MTIADLLKDIIDTSKERVKTPISGAYLLAFLLWNWRPIALLLFEKVTITQKIIVINNDYCNKWAILGPLLLGLFFTVGIPYLMALIDWALMPAKKMRLKNSYHAKTNDINEQLQIVETELKLQDKRNRSKTTEDFEIKIKELESRIETEKATHNVIVEGYENKVKDLTEKLQNEYNDKTSEVQKHAKTKSQNALINMMTKTKFHRKDFNFMYNIKLPLGNFDHFNSDSIDKKILDFLVEKNFANLSTNGYQFTESGEKFIEFIQSYNDGIASIQLDGEGNPINSFLTPNKE